MTALDKFHFYRQTRDCAVKFGLLITYLNGQVSSERNQLLQTIVDMDTLHSVFLSHRIHHIGRLFNVPINVIMIIKTGLIRTTFGRYRLCSLNRKQLQQRLQFAIVLPCLPSEISPGPRLEAIDTVSGRKATFYDFCTMRAIKRYSIDLFSLCSCSSLPWYHQKRSISQWPGSWGEERTSTKSWPVVQTCACDGGRWNRGVVRWPSGWTS